MKESSDEGGEYKNRSGTIRAGDAIGRPAVIRDGSGHAPSDDMQPAAEGWNETKKEEADLPRRANRSSRVHTDLPYECHEIRRHNGV